MSAAQGVFLGAFTVVVLAVVAFTGVVLASARRIDGGGFVGVTLRRMARSRRDRAEAARWAFYAHRISGFGIFAFLCLHVLDVSLYAVSSSLYDDVHRLYGTAPMRVFECALLVAICFHTLNGLRLLAVDVADLGLVASLRLLAGVGVLTAVLSVAGTVVIMGPVVS